MAFFLALTPPLPRGRPFIFTTGYDATGIPNRFERTPCCKKPLSTANVVQAISRAMHPWPACR